MKIKVLSEIKDCIDRTIVSIENARDIKADNRRAKEKGNG